jgi:alpha-D-xyloside xylohydrolase
MFTTADRCRHLVIAAAILGAALLQSTTQAQQVEKTADGIVVPVGDGFLSVGVRSENVIHVMFARDRSFFSHTSIAALPRSGAAPKFEVTSDASQATVSTAALKARVDLKSGAVSFLDSAGKLIAAEKPVGRSLEAADVQGEKTFHVRQQWQSEPSEALYGLVENQLGLINIKNWDLDLWQHNGTSITPFLVSSKGYGIFWDNPSYTRFGDLSEFEPIPASMLIDNTGKAGGLSMGPLPADDGALASPTASATISVSRGARGGGRAGRGAAAAAAPATAPALQPAETPPPGLQPAETPPAASAPAAQARGNRGRGGGGALVSTRFEGKIAPSVTGDYQFQSYSNGGIKVWIDGKLVMDHWRQNWLPWFDVARIHLDAGKQYAIRVDWNNESGTEMALKWKPPVADREAQGTSLWSEVGQGIDYYFCYGPSIDKAIAGFRNVTGKATMLPNWAMGYWQSRDHYTNQQESIDAVKTFREKQIPLDNIVQDWQYWPGASLNTVGSWAFDPARFPDPVAWIKAIHEQRAHLMISVWGWISAQSIPDTNYQEMAAKNYLLGTSAGRGGRTFADFFNPGASKLFWEQLNRLLFSKGIDAWWLDASEPDIAGTPTLDAMRTLMNPNGMGTGAKVLNAYPVLESKAIYEGQREAAPNQRVFILTRSGYPGMQRYSAVVWSGDTTSTWPAMKKQIAAGLSYSISGMPYWTMDIGGYALPGKFGAVAQRTGRPQNPADAEEWDELNTRWFQFGTFVPMMRVHGQGAREIYHFGDAAQQAMIRFDKLRYALMPYIYSLNGAVTQEDATIMRPLVMDFASDPKVLDIDDEYMFGPALLVSPVSVYKARSRSVYLPNAAGWYEFFSGKSVKPATTVDAAAPYDSLPLFVKAGSILPTGPVMQYVGEKPSDPLTLYVYTGADGAFTLYEDEGVNYNYEKGAFAQIPISWNEAAKTLTLGKRQGSFPGMLSTRTFNIIFVSPEKPVGFSFEGKADKSVSYSGDAVQVKP